MPAKTADFGNQSSASRGAIWPKYRLSATRCYWRATLINAAACPTRATQFACLCEIGVSGASSRQYRASMVCRTPTAIESCVPSENLSRTSFPNSGSSSTETSAIDLPTTSGNSSFDSDIHSPRFDRSMMSLIRGSGQPFTTLPMWQEKRNRRLGNLGRGAVPR
jgi:hypothetical protein